MRLLPLVRCPGHGTPRDLPAAFNWIQLSARAGGRDAMNMLGRCHELGWGTDVNLVIAAHCYRAAAELKHHWAEFNLACLILREDGVPGELAEDAGAGAPGERGVTMVGRFSPRSRVAPGDAVRAVVDTRSLHFFDPDTGLGIYEATTKGPTP